MTARGNPTAVAVKALDDYKLLVSFENDEIRVYDLKPVLEGMQGKWYGELLDADYFRTVRMGFFDSGYSFHVLRILQRKNSHEAHHPVGVRVSRPLCRDPHVLLDADAELDLDFVVVVDLDPLHQPGNDHVLGFCVGLVEGVRPGE